MDAVIAEGEKKDVKPKDETERNKTVAYLTAQLKALIARDLWDMNEFYQIWNEQNDIVQKAVEVMK